MATSSLLWQKMNHLFELFSEENWDHFNISCYFTYFRSFNFVLFNLSTPHLHTCVFGQYNHLAVEITCFFFEAALLIFEASLYRFMNLQ